MITIRPYRAALPGTLMLLALTTSPLHGQDPAPTRLSGRVASAIDFSAITALRELSDGRVLVADAAEKQITLLDPSFNRQKTVGRIGQGPGEFGGIGAMSAVAADTTLLQDNVNQRLLKIHPDGTPGETLPIPGQTSATGNVRMVGGAPVQIHSSGRYCKPVMSAPSTTITQGVAVATTGDSITIACGRLGTDEVAEVVRLRAPAMQTSQGGTGMVMNMAVQFGHSDGWTLAPSGEIAVIRSDPFRVEWLAPDKAPVTGPVIPHSPIKVTQKEIERVNEAFAQMMSRQMGRTTIGGGGESRSAASVMAGMKIPVAETKSPFDPAGIVAGPGNEVWIRRHMPEGSAPTYDVFDRSGRRIRRVELDHRARVVAVTARGVYVATVDDDGLHRLERWNRPT